jgi:hypothetical protein
MTFAQRLALQVYAAVRSPMGDNKNSTGARFPYGFAAYAKAAATCQGRRLAHDWR